MKKILLFLGIFLLLSPAHSGAQGQTEWGNITGTVVTRVGRTPIPGATVTLWSTPEVKANTATNGTFSFSDIPYGVYRITVEAPEFLLTEISVRVNTPERDINFITMAPDAAMRELVDDSAFSEFDFDGGDAQAMPVTLSASRDIFDNVAGYKFGALRFRTRGYDTGLQDVYMNGIQLNDAMNGYSPWSLWSGLNEATRNQEAMSGLAISNYGVGGINGITNIDTRASSLRQGFRASVVNASAQYALRLMATYSSGMLDNGWAYAASVSLRYGPNYWVDGVYYNAWGYYLSVEKQFNPLHRLSFTFLGVPTKRGAQMGATDEAYGFAGNFYNPNWGYQEGKKRNARVRDYHEPLAILNYNFDISDKTRLTAAASFRFGKNGYSALDWYKGRDPKPDYYRNLPSYQVINQDDDRDDMNKFYDQFDFWTHNDQGIRQIDWDWMYQTNYRQSQWDPTGEGPGRAIYIVSERHTDQRDFNFNATLSHEFNVRSRINGGINVRANRTEYYTTVKDLLGGEYWMNVDNFADRDFSSGGDDVSDATRNNLLDDNLIVKEGDKYGYDYYGFSQTYKLWANYSYSSGPIEANIAAEGGYAALRRYGLYQKGLFPDNSYGNSEKPNFFTYTAKGAFTYKFSGQHQASISGIAMEKAPYFQDAFVSPRTRNSLVPHLTTEKVYGGDLSYSMRTPWLTLRLSAFYTQINDQTKLISYYDDVQRAFTNFAMSDMDQRHMGIELGVRVPVYRGFSVSGALSYGDYIYNSNPRYTQTIDNSATVAASNEVVYYDGLKVENTPQFAANISLNYRTESYWFFELDFSYFDQYYLSMNPLRRSQRILDLVSLAGEKQGLPVEDIVQKVAGMQAQEKFDPSFVMNASIGKSWYIQRKYQFGFSLQLKNLLNTTNIRTGGFEQMRLYREQVAWDNDTDRNPVYDYTPFDSKYFYLYGFNWYLNVYFRF